MRTKIYQTLTALILLFGLFFPAPGGSAARLQDCSTGGQTSCGGG
jgi:hypothetical protein